MTRAEAEKRIGEKLFEIYKIMREFDPDNYYVSLFVNSNEFDNALDADSYLHFNNEYWTTSDEEKKIDKSIWLKGGEIVE